MENREVYCECQGGNQIAMENKNNQKAQEVNEEQMQEVSTITVGSVLNYSISANISGAWVSFLVDTGASVSLIDGKVWDSLSV